ncbi:hypothetical protein Syun_026430 [Stephania yunnanensis]|uniref:Uncharacterized protein n=1 Tax=Stephania yunnanensis TaxID=152371 RepID=A0AAP0ETK3_9MAGN
MHSVFFVSNLARCQASSKVCLAITVVRAICAVSVIRAARTIRTCCHLDGLHAVDVISVPQWWSNAVTDHARLISSSSYSVCSRWSDSSFPSLNLPLDPHGTHFEVCFVLYKAPRIFI